MADRILFEGATERKLLEILCAEGKKTRFNPFENEIKKLARLINKKDTVYIVYDTDVMHQAAVDRFFENINSLLGIAKKVVLVQQTRNMEEELYFACGSDKKLKVIYTAFSAVPPTAENFKNKFINSSNSLQILEGLGLDRGKLFSRGIDVRLSKFSKYLGRPKYRSR